jgi:hypothetical protein
MEGRDRSGGGGGGQTALFRSFFLRAVGCSLGGKTKMHNGPPWAAVTTYRNIHERSHVLVLTGRERARLVLAHSLIVVLCKNMGDYTHWRLHHYVK